MGNLLFAVRVSYQGTSGPRTAVATMITSVVGAAVDVFYDPEVDESIVIRARHDQSAWFSC